MVEKANNATPSIKRSLPENIVKKTEEKPVVQQKVETQKETPVENLNWKSSLKSFELQEEATLDGNFI